MVLVPPSGAGVFPVGAAVVVAVDVVLVYPVTVHGALRSPSYCRRSRSSAPGDVGTGSAPAPWGRPREIPFLVPLGET
ncbi:hypothetical protein FHR93_002714 [Geodermatophilus sabuli]|uniref:Uncharacterized protein n=1 Tax=Geodermatophilus sabuli TaxID=1564158 RepID=A0A285EE49_9ACTN|nr:hypothetical protein [Geodermatophilus sabuli]SNX97305.1 hypothetical protein SAMN06893097_106255 [Geodermatophilus sabuli]